MAKGKAKGWYPVHRQIQEHWVWKEKPFSKGQAWIDLLLLANHDDNKILSGNELMIVECGSLITSIEKLKARWGWSNTKVINFLKLLESDEMVIRKSDAKKSLITIVNYSKFNTCEKTETMQKRYENDTKTIQKHTNNNYNNDNNKKKENIKERKRTSYDEILSQVVDCGLRDLYIEFIKMRKIIKSPMTDRALSMLIKKVNELEPTDIDRQKKLLETAIMNNWKSVYPLKDEKTKKDYAAYDLELINRILNAD